jgi:hypothetical protein
MLFTRLHAHIEGWSRTNEYCQNLLHFLCQSTLRVWATLTSVWLSLIFHPALVATERFLIKGLPKDPQVKRTGPFGTKLDFSYAPGQAGTNVNHFEWNSELDGNGRGPFTNGGFPRRFCKVESAGTNKESFNCWFPCYQNADER